MPRYEYRCTRCGQVREVTQRITEDPIAGMVCGCGGRMSRIISNSSFQLKGGGWYKDGYGASNGMRKNTNG